MERRKHNADKETSATQRAKSGAKYLRNRGECARPGGGASKREVKSVTSRREVHRLISVSGSVLIPDEDLIASEGERQMETHPLSSDSKQQAA